MMGDSYNFSKDSEILDFSSRIENIELLQSKAGESQQKEQIVISNLNEAKQLSNYLEKITQELVKERKVSNDKSRQEQLLWKLIEKINSSFDIDFILQTIVDELGNYFKIDRLGIIIPSFKDGKDRVKEFAINEWARSKEIYSQVSLSVLYKNVVTTLKPLIINDTLVHEITAGHLSEDLRSILMVPLLRHGNELVGVVYLHQCRKQRNWIKDDLLFLQTIVEPISSAIEKSKLFAKTKAWAAREKLLNKLISRIRGTLDINSILERTVAELGQALHSSRCLINIIDTKTSKETISHEYIANNIKELGVKKENPLLVNKFARKDAEYIAVCDVFNEQGLNKLNEKEIKQLYRTEARAILAVPISFHSKLFGWLCFHQCNVPRRWTDEEIAFVQTIASNVGVALNQAELVQQLTEYQIKISRELKQAASLQSALLSSGADTKKNLPIAVSYHPHHNVSGDFYWVEEFTPGVVSILIGDVSGKGPAAALLMGYIVGEMKGLLRNPEIAWSPAKFMTMLSDAIYTQNQFSDFYATAWYGIFDVVEGKLLCSNAGHPSPYLIGKNNIENILDKPGVPLGLLSSKDGVGEHEEKEFRLNPGDRLIVFTDGLTEQRQLDGTFLHEEWIKEALNEYRNVNLSLLPEKLIEKLNILSKGAEANDDRLVLTIELPKTNDVFFDSEDQEEINEKLKAIINDALEKGLPPTLEPSLKLGLIEAIYNSFRHGLSKLQAQKRRPISLSWWIKENSFSCSIRDVGDGFDWKSAQLIKNNLAAVDVMSEGGRGLPLLFEIFNTVTWNPKGNEIGLILNW